MQRKEKEIHKKSEIEAVIHKSLVCRLGLSDCDRPYIVPLGFGYQDHTIYIHGSLKGEKIDIIRKNQNVCFEFDIDTEIVEGEKACEWSMKYRSVVGFGKACLLENKDEKRKALHIIMSQYSNRIFRMPENLIDRTALIKIEITSMTGKQSGY